VGLPSSVYWILPVIKMQAQVITWCLVASCLAFGESARVSTGGQDSAEAEALSGIEPTQLQAKVTDRICVMRTAAEFQMWVQSLDLAPQNHGLLSEDMGTYYEVADGIEAAGLSGIFHKEVKELTKRKDELLANVNAWGFSAYWANKHCASERESYEKSSDCQKTFDELKHIDELLVEGVVIEKEKSWHKCLTNSDFMSFKRSQPVKDHWKDLTEKEKALMVKVKEEIQGKSPEKTFQAAVTCKLKEATQSDFSVGEMTARIAAEMKNPAMKTSAGCVENSTYGYCPEGMSPQFLRASDPARAARWTGYGLAAGLPVGIVGGGLIGALRGLPLGPAGMAATMSQDIVTGIALPLGPPLAALGMALGSKDLLASCRCFENSCELDHETDTCVMSTSAASSNPYQGLPYPGQKCVRSATGCAMQLCSESDFKEGSGEDGFFGSLGVKSAGVFNCLSLGGDSQQTLISLEKLPSEVENSAASRTELYKKMKVQLGK